MEAFGIIGFTFGLLAFVQAAANKKELSRIKKALRESKILEDARPDEKQN